MGKDDVLSRIISRPEIYTGQSDLSGVFAFLNGYIFAKHESGIDASGLEERLERIRIILAESLGLNEQNALTIAGFLRRKCGSDETAAMEEFRRVLGELYTHNAS